MTNQTIRPNILYTEIYSPLFNFAAPSLSLSAGEFNNLFNNK